MVTHLSAALLAALAVAPQQQTDTTLAVAADGRLEVHNVMEGSVTIRTWDQARARVAAEFEGDDAVEIRYAAPTLSVLVRPERLGDERTELDITIPKGMSVEVTGIEMSLSADGLGANVIVNSVEGGVQVRGGRGNINLNSVEGGVSLDGAEGNIALVSVDGDVSVNRSTGVVSVQNVDGDILLEGITSDNVEVNTVDGDLLYRGTIRDDGRYFLSTHDGDVTIEIPEGTNARVSVSTFSGDLEADFPVTLAGSDNIQKSLSFTLGTGKALVEISTFDGLIQLVRP
ncbi:MAG: DUF4097 family beta strand repeat-containing protein [Gemmatimonadota bacterium]|jgi:hypothetical protein